jgi:serine phosphatase RsbU (regulator of sigma subunit)
MIGTSLLNEIIIEKEIEDTNQILDELRNSIIATMNKNISVESDEKIRNGMDISLCCWDLTTNELSFSGANNPIFIYRNGELIEFKPDKQPIGVYKRMTPFTKQTLQIQKGDKIYSFSDGYPDQMNEQESRLKIANFKTLILDTAKIKTADQKIIFEATYEKWKGNYDQIDDVVLIGVEI